MPVTHLRPDGDPGGLKPGASVTVTPDDYGKVPVAGELVTLDHHRIAVRRRRVIVAALLVANGKSVPADLDTLEQWLQSSSATPAR